MHVRRMVVDKRGEAFRMLCAQEPEGKAPLEPHILRRSIGILNEIGYGATGIPRVDLEVTEVRKRGCEEDENLRVELRCL